MDKLSDRRVSKIRLEIAIIDEYNEKKNQTCKLSQSTRDQLLATASTDSIVGTAIRYDKRPNDTCKQSAKKFSKITLNVN